MTIQIDKLKGPLMHEHKRYVKGPINPDIVLGNLYNGYVIDDPRGIALLDWRLPIGTIDYVSLVLAVDPIGDVWTNTVGPAVKETGVLNWQTANGTNTAGFNGKGAGFRTEEGDFVNIKVDLSLWASHVWAMGDTMDIAVLNNSESRFYVPFSGHGSAVMNIKGGASIRFCRNTVLPNGTIGTYTDYEGKVYPTKVFGELEWMCGNLATLHYANGDLIPNVTDNMAWSLLSTGAMCFYNNDPANGYKSGTTTNNGIARFDGTDGRTVMDSSVTISDDGEMSNVVGADKVGLYFTSEHVAIVGEGLGEDSYGVIGRGINIPIESTNTKRSVTGVHIVQSCRGNSTDLEGPVQEGFTLRKVFKLPVNDYDNPSNSEVHAGAIDCLWDHVTTNSEESSLVFWVMKNRELLPSMKLLAEGKLFLRNLTNTAWVEVDPTGTPKGVAATLATLEAAYPTGTTGIYVTQNTGHWYFWNGLAWTDGGLYQGPVNNVVHVIGTSSTDVMSQAAITSELYDKSYNSEVITTTAQYIRYINGELTDAAGYRSSNLIACTPSDTILASGYTSSAISCGIAYYNSEGFFVGYEIKGTGIGSAFVDHFLTIPPTAAFYRIGGYYTSLPSSKKMTSLASKFYTAGESDSLFLKKTSSSSNKYGIRWQISGSDSACERLYDAVGLTAIAEITDIQIGSSDFDLVYPWSGMRRCNILININGAKILTYEGETGFALDGTNGDVFVEIPKFYYERNVISGYEYRIISAAGTNPHPAFIEQGKELDHIYVGTFEGSYDSALKSISGVRPCENEFAQTYLEQAKAKGIGYTLLDSRTIDAVQNLMWIEYANRNSTSVIGHGWAHLIQPTSSYSCYLSENNVNRVVLNNLLSNNDQERLFPGANMTICQDSQYNIIARRKIVSVTLDTPTPGQTQVVFDGSPINTDPTIFIGNGPQDTDGTNGMTFHTGRTDRSKVVISSTLPRNTLNPNRYRWIENLCGNVWHLLPDICFNELQMYVCKNISDYEFFKITSPYIPVANLFTQQSSNSDGFWITDLLHDFEKNIAIGAQFGNTGGENLFFGGFYYLGSGLVCIAHGGGFDHHIRCNITTNRGWINGTTKWYLYGCRLIFKYI